MFPADPINPFLVVWSSRAFTAAGCRGGRVGVGGARRDIPGGHSVAGAGHERVHQHGGSASCRRQTQSFLAMLCSFNYATFAYYATKAAWVTVMTVFIALSLPETKGIPLESMSVVWARHWNWKRSVVQDQRKSDVALT
jgi:hypothetical protein